MPSTNVWGVCSICSGNEALGCSVDHRTHHKTPIAGRSAIYVRDLVILGALLRTLAELFVVLAISTSACFLGGKGDTANVSHLSASRIIQNNTKQNEAPYFSI